MEITVTPELEEYVASKVASGTYTSPSEVFVAGLEALRDREGSNNQDFTEQDFANQWLLGEIGPAYDEIKAHPERAVPIDEVFAELRSYHAERVKSRG